MHCGVRGLYHFSLNHEDSEDISIAKHQLDALWLVVGPPDSKRTYRIGYLCISLHNYLSMIDMSNLTSNNGYADKLADSVINKLFSPRRSSCVLL